MAFDSRTTDWGFNTKMIKPFLLALLGLLNLA